MVPSLHARRPNEFDHQKYVIYEQYAFDLIICLIAMGLLGSYETLEWASLVLVLWSICCLGIYDTIWELLPIMGTIFIITVGQCFLLIWHVIISFAVKTALWHQ